MDRSVHRPVRYFASREPAADAIAADQVDSERNLNLGRVVPQEGPVRLPGSLSVSLGQYAISRGARGDQQRLLAERRPAYPGCRPTGITSTRAGIMRWGPPCGSPFFLQQAVQPKPGQAQGLPLQLPRMQLGMGDCWIGLPCAAPRSPLEQAVPTTHRVFGENERPDRAIHYYSSRSEERKADGAQSQGALSCVCRRHVDGRL